MEKMSGADPLLQQYGASDTDAAPPPALLNAVPSFDGRGDGLAWLSSLRRIARLYRWSQGTCLVVAEIKLLDAAQRWVDSRRFSSWSDFMEQFQHRFGETRESAIARLERCIQTSEESPQAYADRFLQFADRAGRADDDALLFQFIRGLNDGFKVEAARQRLHSIEDVMPFCNYWQSVINPEYSVKDRVSHYETQQQQRLDRFQVGYKARFEDRYNRPQPREDRQGFYRGGIDRRPPFNSNGYRPNRGPAAADNRPRYDQGPQPYQSNNNRPPVAHGQAQQDVAALADKFSKLEINFSQVNQALQEKDKQLRTLRHVLESQLPSMNMIMPVGSDTEADKPGEDDDIDVDYLNETLAAIYQKRSAEEAAVAAAAPSKPQADPLGLSQKAKANMAAPRNRVPFTVTADRQPPPAAGNAADRADEHGKMLASECSKHLRFDGSKEGCVLPQSVLLCAAGYLINDRQLVSKGREVAARVEKVARSMLTTSQPAASSAAPLHNIHTSELTAKTVPTSAKGVYSSGGRGKQLVCCYVKAKLNGQHVRRLVDTRACGSAVSLDGLRGVRQDSLLRPGSTSYITAEGKEATTRHVLPNMAVGLGDFTTRVQPTVTEALTYDFLIGNDVLEKAKAKIDYKRKKLTVSIDPHT